jgi:predicted SAM-dependent methyltransferase
MRVNVGCGRSPIQGWRNFDNSLSIRLARIPLLPSVLAQLRFLGTSQREFIDFLRSHEVEYADAAGRLPIADGVVEVVYSSHMLEHLDQNEASTFLTETMRVLQPGGIVRLALPDIKKQVEAYLSGGNADTFIAGTHLTQPRARSLASRLRLLVTGTRHHHWMYDGSSLCQLLASRGFARPIVVAPGETRIPNPGELDLFERSSESVYVEAEKA